MGQKRCQGTETTGNECNDMKCNDMDGFPAPCRKNGEILAHAQVGCQNKMRIVNPARWRPQDS